MHMGDIGSNFQEIRRRIAAAAERAGRSSAEVTLIAVSKTKPAELVEEAYLAGVRVFGENRVQEIADKFVPRPHDDIELHMIGTLQSNKARSAVAACDWIQSVDRDKILLAVSRHAEELGRRVNVCIEVNTSGEMSKHGLEHDGEVLSLAERALGLPGIRLRGLMTIGPLLSQGEEPVRRAFSRLSALHRLIGERLAPPDWDTLSMGMSNDFELAIEHGATMVRIGTSIFGSRPAGGAHE
jgi:pyridoxal phosphate enzyme (YggS family)